jgi:adenylate cyclase
MALLLFAVGGTVAVILAIRSRSLDLTSKTIQKEISQQVGDKLLERAESTESLLREYMRLVEGGLIPVGDQNVLAEWFATRLQCDNRYEWFGLVRSDGVAGGAVRRGDGRIVLHRVRSVNGKLELSREIVNRDGTREFLQAAPVNESDLRVSPWYKIGVKNTKPTWVKRYIRPLDGTPGWACAVSVSCKGKTIGVLGVGFGLAFMENYLNDIHAAKTGRVFLLSSLTGEIGIAPSAEDMARLAPVIEKAIARLPDGVKNMSVGESAFTSIKHNAVRYVVAFEGQQMTAGAAWINALVIPEKEIIGFANRYLIIGLFGISLVFVIGLILAGTISKRVSQPLQTISHDLQRVGKFELSRQPMPQSMIQEIAVVGDSVERMKAGLRSFGRYVPTDLVRELLSEGQEARLGGQVKNLTLFFSDVEGFTSLSENMTPQSLVEVLGEYLRVVTGVVGDCGGVIDKFIGDGILAFFNAPHADPDHSVNACLCALKVQKALEGKRPEWQAEGKAGFHTRIGLHTDDVVVGNIGTPERFSYTVIGDGVNLAARLESLNKVYGTWILVSENTRSITGDRFEWRRIDRTAVKGRVKGEFVYELLGERGNVSQRILQSRDRHEAALSAYLDRRFEKAIREFEEAAQIRPGDNASNVLRKRAEIYLHVPPSPDWDGTFFQAQK